MNKNLSSQTAQPLTEHRQPSREDILLALRMRRLVQMPEWAALTKVMQPEIDTLQALAFNSARPQPARINALEQISGMRIVLDYPESYCKAIDEMLEGSGQTVDSYLKQLENTNEMIKE